MVHRKWALIQDLGGKIGEDSVLALWPREQRTRFKHSAGSGCAGAEGWSEYLQLHPILLYPVLYLLHDLQNRARADPR
jgi:hypothetical protein